MSTMQILHERGFNSDRVAIVIGETYPWCRDREEPTTGDLLSPNIAPKSGSIDGFASLEAAAYLEVRL